MRIFLKILFVIVSPPLVAGGIVALVPFLERFGAMETRHIVFLCGAGLAVVLYPWLRMSKFFRTFEHELTHLVAAKACFARMESLQVHSSGNGEVRYSRESNFIIALAPYFLPLFAIGFAALSPLLHPKIAAFALAPAGFLLSHHLLAAFEEAFAGQPDISESGRIFSIAFIGVFGLLFYGAILSYASGGHAAVIAFLKGWPPKSWDLVYRYVPLVVNEVIALFRNAWNAA
jgi:hypothetical protein